MGEAWEITIQDLGKRKAALEEELAEIELTLASLRKLYKVSSIPSHESLRPISPPPLYGGMTLPPTRPSAPNAGRFSSISVRWAVLWLLNDDLTEGASTPEIAQHLLSDGVTSKSTNFNSNVSAVLSAMRDRGEVQQDATKWFLTDDGRQAWSHIRSSRVFNNPNSNIK
jgi:hypothetical protein